MKSIGTVGRMWADSMYSSFTDSLVDMMAVSQQVLCKPGERIHYVAAPISWHEGARNHLVEHMEGDWLLQLDTDHVFAPDVLIRMIRLAEKNNLPVLSAIYQYKHPPHQPVMGLWAGEAHLNPIVDWDPEAETVQVGACGAGCLLVRKEVFKRVKRELKEAPFAIRPGLSEDYSFFKRCQELGIPVHVAPKIECHHTIRTILSVQDYVPAGNVKKVQQKDGVIIVPEGNK